MSNIQIVDLPALPEVEEVCLSDVEDELLLRETLKKTS